MEAGASTRSLKFAMDQPQLKNGRGDAFAHEVLLRPPLPRLALLAALARDAFAPRSKPLQIGLIGLIQLDSPRSATIKEWTGPAMCPRLATDRFTPWKAAPPPAAQNPSKLV
jgi:hypothetical protein